MEGNLLPSHEIFRILQIVQNELVQSATVFVQNHYAITCSDEMDTVLRDPHHSHHQQCKSEQRSRRCQSSLIHTSTCDTPERDERTF